VTLVNIIFSDKQLLASRFTEKALAQAITGSIVSEHDFKVHMIQESKASPRAMYSQTY
jgi:hypothetical protein